MRYSNKGWGDNNAKHHDDRLYGCARFGCHKVNLPYESYGAVGRSWCLGHAPRLWERLYFKIIKHPTQPNEGQR